MTASPQPLPRPSTDDEADLRDAVESALCRALSAVESEALLLCYGLDDAPPCRPQVAARRLRLRPAELLRLQRRAMRKLRRDALAESAPSA